MVSRGDRPFMPLPSYTSSPAKVNSEDKAAEQPISRPVSIMQIQRPTVDLLGGRTTCLSPYRITGPINPTTDLAPVSNTQIRGATVDGLAAPKLCVCPHIAPLDQSCCGAAS
ncbi:MAG: hypothetical protein GX456_04975 [Verrucomicrobia bacterium]|nr:hypothetical protein [Verrucomicrobiota bacterium]